MKIASCVSPSFLALFAFALTGAAQQPMPKSSGTGHDVMVVAVSRDNSVLGGGIDSGKMTKPGNVEVELLAYLDSSGNWKSHPCGGNYPRKACPAFASRYLSKPHTYSVVSTDGNGATVRAAPTTLDECDDYTGSGTYSGAEISGLAVAADSTTIFAPAEAPHRLDRYQSKPVLNALAKFVPNALDSVDRLELFSVNLDGLDLIIAQRNFSDFVDVAADRYPYVFLIGTMNNNGFKILHRKHNTDDEEERVFGAIRLKDGPPSSSPRQTTRNRKPFVSIEFRQASW